MAGSFPEGAAIHRPLAAGQSLELHPEQLASDGPTASDLLAMALQLAISKPLHPMPTSRRPVAHQDQVNASDSTAPALVDMACDQGVAGAGGALDLSAVDEDPWTGTRRAFIAATLFGAAARAQEAGHQILHHAGKGGIPTAPEERAHERCEHAVARIETETITMDDA
jgi:hypothetical protein